VDSGRVIASHVQDGSLALSAGFEARDTIATLDGEVVRDLDQLYGLLDRARVAGKPASMAVTRPVMGAHGRVYFAYREVSLPVEELRRMSVDP
jgi:S1-C subfamily serine protease